MGFDVSSYPFGSLLTSAKMTTMQDNDNELLQRIADVSSGHRHDGADSLGPLVQNLASQGLEMSWFELTGSETMNFFIPPGATFINAKYTLGIVDGGDPYVTYNGDARRGGSGTHVASWAVPGTHVNTWSGITFGNASGGANDRGTVGGVAVVTFPNTGY